MFKIFVIFYTFLHLVRSAPQANDVEIQDQIYNRINEAEYDYK
jgi:hypothetical protein